MSTDFQEKLYQFIIEYIDQYQESPMFTHMTDAMGISPRSKSLITRSLRALEKARKIQLQKAGRRLIISLATKHTPLLGRISAGSPIEAIPEYTTIDINQFFQDAHQFALVVKGTSMIEEGILDGDIIFCKNVSSAHEGDIVVALLDQSTVTLKRISYKLKGMITLIPANKDLKPRAYTPERIHIQGVYVGLVRKPS